MASLDRNKGAQVTRFGVDGEGPGLGAMLRRQTPVLLTSLIAGFLIGLAYQARFHNSPALDLAAYGRSGLNGLGIALTAWAVQFVFLSGAKSRLGAAMRRLPLAAEVLVRALVTTLALTVVGLTLQIGLFWSQSSLGWLMGEWLKVDLPRVVLISFALSLVFRLVIESRRLIGREMMMSMLTGAYHRPVRRELIVMFLDLANSTRLAETMGEVRVHDLITRFFFDIDEPITAHGGAVHAYVGDEAIVAWPVTGNPARDGRCIACFAAIEAKMARLAPVYEREFGVAPAFRAGVHAGAVIVSECGESKRQLAYFGDTMNVGARLCDYCKSVDERLIVSGDLMRLVAMPAGLAAGKGELISVRGRQEPLEAYAVRKVSGQPANKTRSC
jgi:class 3 adenylate cyclase